VKTTGLGPLESDSAVRPREFWLVRGVLVVAAFALLATTAPEEYVYSFMKNVDGPGVELTAEAPRASFLVRARAVGLSPERSRTTDVALAGINGQIMATGVDTAAVALVNIRLSGVSRLNVATSFDTSEELIFSGNCDELDDSSPCEAVLGVDFERTDGGTAGGSLSVDWSIKFNATAAKKDEPNAGPLELPWVIEVLPQ
jgi:hypothetical protein